MKRPPLVVTMPQDELPFQVAVRRIRALDWTHIRLNMLDEYVRLGVKEAKDVIQAYYLCRGRYTDLDALSSLEIAIENLENAI